MGGLNTVTVGYAGCQEATGFAVGVPVTKSWTAWNNWWNICSSSWLPGSNDGLVEESIVELIFRRNALPKRDMCFSQVRKVKLLQKRRKMKSSWESCLIELEMYVGIPSGSFRIGVPGFFGSRFRVFVSSEAFARRKKVLEIQGGTRQCCSSRGWKVLMKCLTICSLAGI